MKIQLCGENKIFFKQCIGKGNHSARAIRRARMLLMVDEALKNQQQIALDCNCGQGSVTNLLIRYAECKGGNKRSTGRKAKKWSAYKCCHVF